MSLEECKYSMPERTITDFKNHCMHVWFRVWYNYYKPGLCAY